jgi:hypothetical protein
MWGREWGGGGDVPTLAKRTAEARPMPALAPVMRTVLPGCGHCEYVFCRERRRGCWLTLESSRIEEGGHRDERLRPRTKPKRDLNQSQSTTACRLEDWKGSQVSNRTGWLAGWLR